eukprot:GHVS01023114.1.p1 GENE.GHVS01023114.1~~GHVS01023114.1.p1  ORF type:complete len:753 (-),score=93.42 GHVS01023114.1:333-2591(-)
MIYLTYCMLFLTLVLLLPFVLSDNTEDVYILLAAPSDVAPGLVLGDKMPSSMREITIPGNPCEDILVNNIHALITKGLGADKSSIAGVNWDVKDTDKIFGWKGVAGGTIEISLPKSNSGVYNSVEISLEENQTPHVYMLTCHTDPCSVNRSLLKDWKTKLRTMFNNNANVVFAELLDNWMQRPSSEDEDPWNTLDKSKQKRVLDVERDIRKAEVSKALTIWESHEKKCQEDANENIKDALDSLQMLAKKRSLLDSIESTWENAMSVEMTKQAEKAANEYATKRTNLLQLQQQVYVLQATEHEYTAQRLIVVFAKSENARWRMQAMEKMWEQLYEQQTHGTSVHQTLPILIKAGADTFERLTHSAEAMSEAGQKAREHARCSTAVQAKINMLSTAAAQQGVMNSDDLSQNELLEADAVARNTLLTSMEEDINGNKAELSVAETFKKKLVTVFGDAEAAHLRPEKTKAFTTLEDMVRFVKLRGIEILKRSTDHIKILNGRGDRLVASVETIRIQKNPVIPIVSALINRNRQSIQGYVDWMFLYPQMIFDVELADEQSDAVYCLLIEALKGVFAAGDDWDASKWTSEPLRNSVGWTFPRFTACNVLNGQPVPRFVADYCQSHMEVVAGRAHTSNKGDDTKGSKGGHVGALDTKDSPTTQAKQGKQEPQQPQAKQETQDSAKPRGSHQTQDSGKPRGSQEEQGGEATKWPRRHTIETLKMLMCTTASVVLCTVVVIYAYTVVVLEAGAYARMSSRV